MWNNFLDNNKKEIKSLLLFKSKIKGKLLNYDNEMLFFQLNLFQIWTTFIYAVQSKNLFF